MMAFNVMSNNDDNNNTFVHSPRNQGYKNLEKDSQNCSHCKKTGRTQDKCYWLHTVFLLVA